MHRIRLFCPNCKQEVEADRLDAGRLISCPKCSKTLRVPEADVQPGTQIGAYIVLRHLGSGGMGDVWLAKHTTMDRKVAIKVLSTKYLSNKELIDRFLHEIRLLAKLNHPNIVTAYDAGAYKGIYYLVMNYIEGKELDVIINEKGRLNEFEALLITTYLADALSYAWKSFKIIHRDIKPGNIIIDSQGKPYLMDLGISKSLSDDPSYISLHTKTGLFGTPHFMSPEQVRGEKNISFKSDIYSLGATLFVMLTATYPYDDDNPIVVASKHLTEPVPSPKRFNPLISSETNALVQKMMAKNPSDRFDSWESVILAIEQIANAPANSKTISANSAKTIKAPTLTQASSPETSKKPTLLNYQKPTVDFNNPQKPLKVIPIEENTNQKKILENDKFEKNDLAAINQKKIQTKKRSKILPSLVFSTIFIFIILSIFGLIFYLVSERNKKSEIFSQLEQEVFISKQTVVSQNEMNMENNPSTTINTTTKNNKDEFQKSINQSSGTISKFDGKIKIPSDATVLKKITDIFSIPYPPPPPLKSIPEVEAIITNELSNLNSNTKSYDQKFSIAQKNVLQKLNISSPPTPPSKTIKQIEEENSTMKEIYINNKLNAEFPEIEQERARLKDETKNITPVCSIAEANKRFKKEIEKLFYAELQKRGLPSPLGINLSNEKKIQELSPIYEDIISELKIQHAASFFKKLGFFVITIDKNSYPYIFAEPEPYIEKKLQIFIQSFIKGKPAYAKLVSEAEQKYPIEDYLTNNGYIKFDGEWQPAYKVYQALLDEELLCLPIHDQITLQEQVNKIREKVYTENNYIFYNQEWITYEDFLNRQVKKLNSFGFSDNPPYWVLKYVYQLENVFLKNEERIWELITARLLSNNQNLSENFLRNIISCFYYNHFYSEFFSILSEIDHSKLNSLREALTYNNFPEALKIANTFPKKLSKSLISIIYKYQNNITPNIRNRPDIIWSCSKNGANCYWDQMQKKWKESGFHNLSHSKPKADRPDQYQNLRSENLNYSFKIYNENVFTSMLFVPGEYELALPEIEIVPVEIQIKGDLFENPQLILKLNPNSNFEKNYEFRLINTETFCRYLFNSNDFWEHKKNVRKDYFVWRIGAFDRNFIDLFSNYENWGKFFNWEGKLFGQDISVTNQNSNYILNNALDVNKLYTFNLDKYGIKICEGNNQVISVNNLPMAFADFDYVFQSEDNRVNNLSIMLRYDINSTHNTGTGHKSQGIGILANISLNHLTDPQPNLIIPYSCIKISDSNTTFIRDYLQNKIERPPIKTKMYICKNYEKFNVKITPTPLSVSGDRERCFTLYISPENSNEKVAVPMKLSPINTYFPYYQNFDIDITDTKLMIWFDKIIKLADSEHQNNQMKKCSIEFYLTFTDVGILQSSFSILFNKDLRFNLYKKR